ncbi:MAG TPA: hypothetical protein VGD98_20120 [Ktedonobacteraceae bacterium]
MIHTRQNQGIERKTGLLRAPSVTVARLILASYLLSGWMWSEFVLVLVFFATLCFPFTESSVYFNGTSMFSLGSLAILGPAIMVRQATSARTYLLLARLSSRAAYSRGLMLAAAALRLPLYLYFLALVLLFHRLTDYTPDVLFWGFAGIIPATMLVSVLTVGLCPPIATRRELIVFLAWVAVMLFSFKPLIPLPAWLGELLSITQLPLWPLQSSYTLSLTGHFDLSSLLGLLLSIGYALIIALVAGRWLEKRELLLY